MDVLISSHKILTLCKKFDRRFSPIVLSCLGLNFNFIIISSFVRNYRIELSKPTLLHLQFIFMSRIILNIFGGVVNLFNLLNWKFVYCCNFSLKVPIVVPLIV